jgi:hypothetical protein
MIFLEGFSHVLGVSIHIDFQLRRVLVKITFRDCDTNNVINNEIVLLNEVRVRLLNLSVVSQSSQCLEPIIEFFGLGYFFGPVIYQIEIVHEEVRCLIVGSHDEIILAFLEEPF